MHTTLVKVSENVFRVEGEIKYDSDEGTKVIHYGEDFDKWVNNIDKYKEKYPKLWYDIEVDEFENLGCGKMIVWNRDNYIQFERSWRDLNPLVHFQEIQYCAEESANEYVNLILNLFKSNLIDKNIIKQLHVWSTKKYLSGYEIMDHYKEQNLILYPILSYGFNNSLVAYVNPKYFTESSLIEYEEHIDIYKKIIAMVHPEKPTYNRVGEIKRFKIMRRGIEICMMGENYGVLNLHKNINGLPKKRAREIIESFGTFDKMRRHRKAILAEKLDNLPQMTEELRNCILNIIVKYNYLIKDNLSSDVKEYFDTNRNAAY